METLKDRLPQFDITDEYMLIFSTSMHGFAGHHRAEYGPLARSGALSKAMRPYGCNFLRVPAFCR